jgi:hypothetical protein
MLRYLYKKGKEMRISRKKKNPLGLEKLLDGKIKYRGIVFDGFNKPRESTRKSKKGMVLVKEGDVIKLIHFGDSSMGHNYSPEARRSFKARHARNIAKGKLSAAYWADKILWAGPGGSKKNPPKSQKHVKGKIN